MSVCVCVCVCVFPALRTHSGRGVRVEAVITEAFEQGGLAHAGVAHQDDLEEPVGGQHGGFLLNTATHDGGREGWRGVGGVNETGSSI